MRRAKDILETQDELQEMFDYDPDTGEFCWKINPKGPVSAGDIAGRIHHTGYRVVKLKGEMWAAHRLIFKYMAGEEPEEIDHINRIKDDNRWCNLRAADRSLNGVNCAKKNMKKSARKTCIYRGVRWQGSDDTWRWSVTRNGNVIAKQGYKYPEDAYYGRQEYLRSIGE